MVKTQTKTKTVVAVALTAISIGSMAAGLYYYGSRSRYNNAQFISQSVPATMVAGQSYGVSVTMKNTGRAAWTQSGNYKLGSQNPQDNTIWSPNRRVLLNANETVAPGQQKTFTLNVKAPATPGTYNFQWRMVKEFVGWFGETTPNVSIVISVFTNSINVKDYGAKGDGIADDAPAIQKAIAAAAGGTVSIPAGTYMLGTSAGKRGVYMEDRAIIIEGKSNITLQGDGNASVLKLMPHKKMSVLWIGGSDTKNIVVEKITIDGNKSQRDGTMPWPGGDVVASLIGGGYGGEDITVRNCEIKNGIEDGVGFWNSTRAKVLDCFIHDNGTIPAGSNGIAINGPNSSEGEALRNTVSNNTGAGIKAGYGNSNILIQDNTIEKSYKAGISTSGDSLQTTSLTTGVKIINNVVKENGSGGFHGVSVISSQNGELRGNTIINNYYLGANFSDQGAIPSQNWVVANNTCSNTTSARMQDRGIEITGLSRNITLTGNTCQDNGASLNDQIYIQNASAVNSDWQSVNTISYAEI